VKSAAILPYASQEMESTLNGNPSARVERARRTLLARRVRKHVNCLIVYNNQYVIKVAEACPAVDDCPCANVSIQVTVGRRCRVVAACCTARCSVLPRHRRLDRAWLPSNRRVYALRCRANTPGYAPPKWGECSSEERIVLRCCPGSSQDPTIQAASKGRERAGHCHRTRTGVHAPNLSAGSGGEPRAGIPRAPASSPAALHARHGTQGAIAWRTHSLALPSGSPR
jgi:hypothetical protein